MKLLTIHEKLGHLSFAVLKLLAKCGIIARDLADVDPPMCPGCAYGKAHWRPWRHKGSKNVRPIHPTTTPTDKLSALTRLATPLKVLYPLIEEHQ